MNALKRMPPVAVCLVLLLAGGWGLVPTAEGSALRTVLILEATRQAREATPTSVTAAAVAAIPRFKKLCHFLATGHSECIDVSELNRALPGSGEALLAAMNASGAPLTAPLDAAADALHACRDVYIPFQPPQQSFSVSRIDPTAGQADAPAAAGFVADPFIHQGVLNACTQRALASTESTLSKGNLLGTTVGDTDSERGRLFVKDVEAELSQICGQRGLTYVYGSGAASISDALYDEGWRPDPTTFFHTEERSGRLHNFFFAPATYTMDVVKHRVSGGTVVYTESCTTDKSGKACQNHCMIENFDGERVGGCTDAQQAEARVELEKARQERETGVKAAEDNLQRAKAAEQKQTPSSGQSCDPDAGCTDTCEYARTWWAALQVRCGESGWQDGYCQKLISIQQGCPDRGVILPTPDGEVACAFPASSQDARLTEEACAAQNGISYCIDGDCYCRGVSALQDVREIDREIDICADPAAECLPDGGLPPEGGGEPGPTPPPPS